MHTFIRNGYVEGIETLVENNPQLVIAKSNRGRTSMHLAVLFGNLDIIETLINVNYQVINIPDNVSKQLMKNYIDLIFFFNQQSINLIDTFFSLDVHHYTMPWR